MKQSVRVAFIPFNTPLEGKVFHLYADQAGLLTTGMGYLCNDLPTVAALPWKRPDGTLASRDEVVAMYAAVRSHADADRLKGGGWFARYSTLRLDEADVDALTFRKLDSNEMILRRRFDDYDNWPADAQLAIHSWAWGVGPSAGYPQMSAALRRGDFAEAAKNVTMTYNGAEIGTLVIRNARNRLLLTNAQRVRAFGLDPERLYWPTDVATLVEAAETLPELPVAEDDGGASRRAATTDAVVQAAEDEVSESEPTES